MGTIGVGLSLVMVLLCMSGGVGCGVEGSGGVGLLPFLVKILGRLG